MILRLLGRFLGRATGRLQQTRTLAVLGGASLALALGVAFVPWLFPAAVFRPLAAAVASPAVVLLFGALAGLLGVRAFGQSAFADEDGPDRWTPRRAPERAYYDEHRTAGTEVDAAFDADPRGADDLDALRQTARGRIREVAVSVVAADESIDREAAARRIDAGSWTDDPRAAAFLGGRRLAPLGIRIRDWASGERFERWADRAVAEIEARKRGEYGRGERGRDGRNERIRDGRDDRPRDERRDRAAPSEAEVSPR